MLKADLHIHSNASFDSKNTPEDIIAKCQEKGINCIVIADHGTADGGLKIQKIAPFKVIVAEEILTPHGEVMGMFLKETIPTRIPVAEAIKRVKDQGGIVCIPHAYDKYWRIGLGEKLLNEHIQDIDVIEVFNARSALPWFTSHARTFAQKHGKCGSAGSDAHTIGEIGNAYVEMPDFNTKEEFLNALRLGKIYGKQANPLVHFGSLFARIVKRPFRKKKKRESPGKEDKA